MSEPEEPSGDEPEPRDDEGGSGTAEPWRGDLGSLRPLGFDPGADRIVPTPAPASAPRSTPASGDPRADEDPLAAELDPDAAIEHDSGGYQRPLRLPPPIIDTRKYQRMIGGFGLLLVVAFSIYLYARGGSSTPGVPAGQRLHEFVAPLATSNLAQVDVNAHPVCNPLKPSLRGLNVCDRKPLVLALFVLGYKACVQQVDSLQAIADRFPKYQFAAVAVGGHKSSTAKLVRQHHWTIPVAYDESATVAQLYGVEVCPMVEIANAKGIVTRRLIGKHWLPPGKLAAVVAQQPG